MMTLAAGTAFSLKTTCTSRRTCRISAADTFDPLTITTNSNPHLSWVSLKYRARTTLSNSISIKIGEKWEEYQGVNNWEGLLDPLDDMLRDEILRYGKFVEASYRSFDFDPSSPTYAKCKFPKESLLERSGVANSGYRLTKNLQVTSGIELPGWVDRAPSWVTTQSSWIGYMAVCQDKDEIARLGRRDVVIALRGTATCMEWLENLRATLSPWPADEGGAMVEKGFLSLFTSGTASLPSLQTMIREEMSKLLEMYSGERLSVTVTGHSLGAALATLAAYDINSTFEHAPMVTVVSFGGPRVGNREFRCQLEKRGARVLRIVNSDDIITKVPGFVIDRNEAAAPEGLPCWVKRRVEGTRWVYADVGKELRLSSKESPYLNRKDIATCHDLSTYLHLVDGFVSSTCPFRETVRMVGSAGKTGKRRWLQYLSNN